MENVSIIIVTKGRPELLEKLLLSLEKYLYENEIIILINDAGFIDQKYISLKTTFSSENIHWIHQQFKTPGLARNAGVTKSSHNWLLFLDDDVTLPSDFLSQGIEDLKSLEKDQVIMGGPDQDVENSNIFEKALSLTLTSPMATAHTRFRHKKSPDVILKGDETNLILCNLWVHRSVFEEHQIRFRESFFRNEENVFISDAQSKNLKAIYNPKLSVFHKRKTRFYQLGKALISSGRHRVKSLLIHFEPKHLIFMIPAVWVLYLSGFQFFNTLPYGALPLQLYIALTLFISLKITSKQPQLLGLVILYQVFINLFYGLGILFGLCSLPFWSLRKDKL